jgi:hypothetical protein
MIDKGWMKKGDENWEKISPEIHFMQPSVRARGICYPVSFQGIKIARLFCVGIVDFINKEKWKKGWEFKFDWNGDEKHFFRYMGK